MTPIRLTADYAGRRSFVTAIRNISLYLLEFDIFGNITR